ncbi:hypothetical protein JCM19037_514 [Geomicrobium sp. JCM 19037]|uniref:hypothetical protein n=1 Tax=Geomicrobium sp. JCM 19037 TaxID=1460634 RepID=UPI00045F294C|nr:hypothetical protein [Geomicrobium sp. JCM 19037]GAK02288.1 hypothetical protein JCM19037_514 [Geomicrobium sp. JCM 19037]
MSGNNTTNTDKIDDLIQRYEALRLEMGELKKEVADRKHTTDASFTDVNGKITELTHKMQLFELELSSQVKSVDDKVDHLTTEHEKNADRSQNNAESLMRTLRWVVASSALLYSH